ncbi:MAG: acyl carrier protein phosphodiesterase, partial [Flavobacteriales bacterium]|nr:acyl carrier protein phosphodiesterase [Flavobacteriales bacterium]
WKRFHDEELNVFVDSTYQRLDAFSHHFPASVKQYFPYMKQQNWLYNYQFELGFRKSLEGLDRRSSNPTEMHKAVEVYRENKSEFLKEFEEFIADAERMVQLLLMA